MRAPRPLPSRKNFRSSSHLAAQALRFARHTLASPLRDGSALVGFWEVRLGSGRVGRLGGVVGLALVWTWASGCGGSATLTPSPIGSPDGGAYGSPDGGHPDGGTDGGRPDGGPDGGAPDG